MGDEQVASREMLPAMCPGDFEQLGNKSDTQDHGSIHRGQWSVVVDTLAVGAATVPPLLRAGVAGGLALARHGTGGLARGVGGRAGLDGIVGADVCRRLVNVHFGLKMGAGGSFLPIFYQKHQFLALSKARKDPTWWFCGVFQLVNEAPKRFYGVFQ
ncbi:MAG: hypothetical protein WCG79_08865, partial [Verrucomicrobiota bacterium]